MRKYFWFILEEKYDVYLADTLQAVMLTFNGPQYMKTQSFYLNDQIVLQFENNMKYKHTKEVLNIFLKFIEKIYKKGYTTTKNMYIKQYREDIMNAIKVLEKHWIKYKEKQNQLEMSMDFSELCLK